MPQDSTPPADLAALQAAKIPADPVAGWANGEHVVLGGGAYAYWDGAQWQAGEAP